MTLRRRSFLRTAGVGGLVLAAGSLATACGSSSTGGGGAAGGTGGASADELTSLLEIDAANAAGDLDFQLGAVLALTGSGSFFGDVMSKGIKLAVAQIKAAGGPDITVNFQDHQSGNAQAGARAARQLGIAEVPACLSSYVGAIGSMFPAIEQYGMLTLDGGGGTSNFGQGKPFFWGMRAIEPDDSYIGAVKYWQAEHPDVERVYLVAIDQGPINDVVKANFEQALAQGGMQLAGVEYTTIGATDFSTAIARLKAASPDAVFAFLIGTDPGYFMKDFVAEGLSLPVIGAEYIPDAAEVAGSAFNRYMFATDWFDPDQPPNPWAELFVDSYTKEYGEKPDFWAANYYEDTFAVWDLIRRVTAEGGDPNSGSDLQDALLAEPTFKSVYGGDDDTVGTLTLDTTTHTVTSRPLGVFTWNDGQVAKVADFGLGGEGFELVAG